MTFVSVQCLRALAAFMVVIHHVVSLGDARAAGLLWLQAGVDIFFVISGFVMVASMENKPLSARQFLSARLIRIVPLYWLALAIYLLLLAAAGDRLPRVDEVLRSFLFIFYTDSRTGQPAPYLTQGWSLNYEIYFYLLFALLIRVPTVARIGMLAVFFAAMVALRGQVAAGDALAFRLTSPMPLEFVGGMALGHWREQLRRSPAPLGLALMALAMLVLLLSPRVEPRIVFFGVPAMLVVAGAVIAENLFHTRAFAPVKALGDASYSLYLGHGIVLRAMLLLGARPLLEQPVGMVAAAVVCTLSAFPIYRGIERPLTQLAKGLARPRDARVPVSPGTPPS